MEKTIEERLDEILDELRKVHLDVFDPSGKHI